MMLLTEAEVVELTGYKLAAYQSAWLKDQGIRHFLNARGRVRVTWDAVNGTKRQAKREDSEMRFSFERG